MEDKNMSQWLGQPNRTKSLHGVVRLTNIH